jgi:hypothetical protein
MLLNSDQSALLARIAQLDLAEKWQHPLASKMLCHAINAFKFIAGYPRVGVKREYSLLASYALGASRIDPQDYLFVLDLLGYWEVRTRPFNKGFRAERPIKSDRTAVERSLSFPVIS